MTEYIYYAKSKGAPDYTEEIVLETVAPLTPEQLVKLGMLLEPQGKEFHRVAEYKGEAPDFARTVKI
jgi:hypothetical protein